ncbi:MAG: hypothetical protein WCT05_05775 [Lentisphaeria bacterium]
MLVDETIAQKMFAGLCCGRERCTTEALRVLSDFVLGQQAGNGGFVNRGGQADLYYTMFGLLLVAVLRVPIRRDQVARYLDSLDPVSLDLVHLLCLVRCRVLLAYLALPETLQNAAAGLGLRGNVSEALCRQGAEMLHSRQTTLFPLQDPTSPYSQFLRLSLAQELGFSYAGESLADYCQADGLFSNLKGAEYSSTNASSSALVLGYYGCGCKIESETLRMFSCCQQQDGAFKAADGAPQTDLLSTATAAFALSLYQVKPALSVRDFLYAAFTESGGFSSGAGDLMADLEYTVYGLLLMGVS